ncbi:Uncharacterised protein [Vibrio cholerae]|nr:Uncharacterised protein [Vibrio cholerae]
MTRFGQMHLLRFFIHGEVTVTAVLFRIFFILLLQ